MKNFIFNFIFKKKRPSTEHHSFWLQPETMRYIRNASNTLLGIVFPSFFRKIWVVFFVSFFVGIAVEFIATTLGYGGDFFNWLFVIIFSVYIGYDCSKAQQYPKTVDNAIDSAVDLYLDVINIFLRILALSSKKKNK